LPGVEGEIELLQLGHREFGAIEEASFVYTTAFFLVLKFFMRVFGGLHKLSQVADCWSQFGADGSALTIGNFDGVHEGHKAVIGQLRTQAAALNLPVVVMLFEPQPMEFFAKEKAPARLFRLRDKLAALRALQVDAVVVLSFNDRFAGLSAQQFVEQVLVDALQVKTLVIGDDFRFGAKRAGDFALLQSLGARLGFSVFATQSYLLDGERVSSTRVRAALAAGNFDLARRCLGRPYTLVGRVSRGRQLGRQLGFPTANVLLRRNRSVLSGVFAVRFFVDGHAYEGVASIGVNPTVGALDQAQLEVFVFDFEGDLYGKRVEVEMALKIRDELALESLEELKAWIAKDCERARAFFAAT